MNIAALLAGLFSGLIGSMGLGGGAVLIIYLALFTETEQLRAQGINLIFFVPIALCAVIVYAIKKQIEWKAVLKTALFGLLGAFFGSFLTGFFGQEITVKIFGALLVIMGVKEVLAKSEKN